MCRRLQMFSEITELVCAVAQVVCGHTVLDVDTHLGDGSPSPPRLWLNDPSGPRRAITLNHMTLAITSTNQGDSPSRKKKSIIKIPLMATVVTVVSLKTVIPCNSQLYPGQRTLYFGLRRMCEPRPIKSCSRGSKVWVASGLSGALINL